MDLDIEQIHDVLLEANLPSSISELKNPTEEFVVNLLNTFLRRFHIDVSKIDKPTMEQQYVMSYCEDTDIIGLINLHMAMVQICDRIYIKDLCITDIISPGSKRIRKQAKFLSNFILYANNKESDIVDKINEIQNKAKMLRNTLDKNKKVLKDIKEKELHMQQQLLVKEKLLAEIKNVQARIEKNKKKDTELTGKLTKAEKKKQEAMEHYTSYKAQALEVSRRMETELELNKTISKLQSEIVKSPEEYKARLNELENEYASKLEERKMMEETLKDKKHLMEQQQKNLSFIQKQWEKFGEIRDKNEKLKKISAQEDNINKQVEALKINIKESEMKLESQKNQRVENEVDVLQAQCEERLSPLRNLSSQISSKKKLCEEDLKSMQIQYNENSLKKRETQSAIKKLEEETEALIKNCQDLYDNEMAKDTAMVKKWM